MKAEVFGGSSSANLMGFFIRRLHLIEEFVQTNHWMGAPSLLKLTFRRPWPAGPWLVLYRLRCKKINRECHYHITPSCI
jgi:hypothetical protein